MTRSFTRSAAISLSILLALATAYTVGMTNGFSGCVAVASENLTNRMLRGQ